MFNMDIDENQKQTEDNVSAEGQDGYGNHGKLDDMIKDLSTSLWDVKNEQEYMQVRDRNYRVINESTNSRVVMWAFFEAAVLVCVTAG